MTKSKLVDILYAFHLRLERLEQRIFPPAIKFKDLDRNAQELIEIGKKLKLMAALNPENHTIN
jgi:hypothetical protein